METGLNNLKLTLLTIAIVLVATLVGVSFYFSSIIALSLFAVCIVVTLFIIFNSVEINIARVCIFVFFAFMAFNIEYPILYMGDYGFSAEHPGGLRAAITVNQFYMLLIALLVVSVLKKRKL